MTEEGKGYTLMEDYRLPPVMFTESEANALITAEQLVLKNKDALTNFRLTNIEYTDETDKITNRIIEPFALYNTQQNWLLIAFCHLRNDFRIFRLDRIKQLNMLNNTFEPHRMTIEEYFGKYF